MRTAAVTLFVLVFVAFIIAIAGNLSHLGTPPDPNDPTQAGLLTPEVLLRSLSGASDNLLERVRMGELSDEEYKNELSKAANKLLGQINIDKIPPAKAWEYGQVYITARRWEDAQKALEIAVKAAKTEDRRVNDTLRLARVLAEMNQIPAAIQKAKTAFTTGDTDAAPILPATLYEIVPAAEDKGHDPELAALLEQAIKCEERTIVDPKSNPGQDFLQARPFHVRRAWDKVIQLYRRAGKNADAEDALNKQQASDRADVRT